MKILLFLEELQLKKAVSYTHLQGWMAIIAPTGLILATLEMVDVSYNKWIKFIAPLMGILLVLAIVMLGIQTVI